MDWGRVVMCQIIKGGMCVVLGWSSRVLTRGEVHSAHTECSAWVRPVLPTVCKSSKLYHKLPTGLQYVASLCCSRRCWRYTSTRSVSLPPWDVASVMRCQLFFQCVQPLLHRRKLCPEEFYHLAFKKDLDWGRNLWCTHHWKTNGVTHPKKLRGRQGKLIPLYLQNIFCGLLFFC